jgi:hypothetical protein
MQLSINPLRRRRRRYPPSRDNPVDSLSNGIDSVLALVEFAESWQENKEKVMKQRDEEKERKKKEEEEKKRKMPRFSLPQVLLILALTWWVFPYLAAWMIMMGRGGMDALFRSMQ